MSFIKTIVLASFVLALAQPTQAGSTTEPHCGSWIRTVTDSPAWDDDEDTCYTATAGQAEINIPGTSMWGVGLAWDGYPFCDIFVQVSETGLQKITCRWKRKRKTENFGGDSNDDCDCRGHVTVTAKVEAWGDIYLYNGPSKAAGVGSVDAKTSITTTIKATLTASQGATGKSGGGSLTIKSPGGGISIAISGGSGIGFRSDHDQDTTDGEACTNFYTSTVRCSGIILCHTYSSGFGEAECDAYVDGIGSAKEKLTICDGNH